MSQNQTETCFIEMMTELLQLDEAVAWGRRWPAPYGII